MNSVDVPQNIPKLRGVCKLMQSPPRLKYLFPCWALVQGSMTEDHQAQYFSRNVPRQKTCMGISTGLIGTDRNVRRLKKVGSVRNLSVEADQPYKPKNSEPSMLKPLKSEPYLDPVSGILILISVQMSFK